MVGISVMTCYAPRAYELATEFRKRGKTVVLAASTPTYCPKEALQYCDTIVCGRPKTCGRKPWRITRPGR